MDIAGEAAIRLPFQVMRLTASRLQAVDPARLLRWVPHAAVGMGLAFLALPLVAVLAFGSPYALLIAAVGALLLVVLFGHLLRVGVGLARPRHDGWVLCAAAAVSLGSVLVMPPDAVLLGWLTVLVVPAVGSLIVLHGWPAGLASVVFVVLAPTIAVLLGGSQIDIVATTLQVVWRGATLLAVVWLAGALRALESTRQQQVEQILATERERIDADLERTVGLAFADLKGRGTSIVGATEISPDQVRGLIDTARSTLATARQLIRSYRSATLEEEALAAVALLEAAGMTASVVVTPASVGGEASSGRAQLRAAVSDLLQHPQPAATVIVTLDPGGQTATHVVVRAASDAAGPTS